MNTALWWIRRDLRLHDNQALTAALDTAKFVLPVFILDTSLWDSPYVGEKRLAFLLQGLRALDADLRTRGSRIFIRQGHPLTELTKLLHETGAEAIFAESDVSPYARRRDAEIAAKLSLHLTGGLTLHPPDAVHKKDGMPYTVYTPFQRTWKTLPPPGEDELLPAPDFIPTLNSITTLPIPDTPTLSASVPFIAGEAEAQRRLAAFSQASIDNYAHHRDRMAVDGTSKLSPYLRFGMLSARQAIVTARQAIAQAQSDEARVSAETWLNELIWREFYIGILYNFPDVRRQSFRKNLRGIQWENDPTLFAAWCEGRTGYPIVDAGMRQLRDTGWMHNRARMIVAAFLTKDLLIDWRWGEKHFMQHLIDGDPAANNGGWQWSAGTGTDAAPYFRIFNPTSQGERHDPHGDYVRRWVPELANVPTKYIHKPWQMSLEVQQQSNCIIGELYPVPIIDHKWARQRALQTYKAARENKPSAIGLQPSAN